MKIIDLSQPLIAGHITFPVGGESAPDKPPVIQLISLDGGVYSPSAPQVVEAGWLSRISTSGYNWIKYELDSHAGTHVDSPRHFIPDGMGVDAFPLLQRLVGRARVVRWREGEATAQHLIKIAELLRDKIVLIYTGWPEQWEFGSAEYFADFPTIDFDAAQVLLEAGAKCVGIDTPSLDPLDSEYMIHNLLLGNSVPMVENLCNLKELIPYREVLFIATPLKIVGGDACPVRAIAIVEEDPDGRYQHPS